MQIKWFEKILGNTINNLYNIAKPKTNTNTLNAKFDKLMNIMLKQAHIYFKNNI